MTLSGGALAISLTFIKDVIKIAQLKESAIPAHWLGGLLVSVVFILVSMLTSHWSLVKAIRQTDEDKIQNERPGKSFAVLTEWLNALASVGFIVGVIFLAFFAFQNMSTVSTVSHP